jgi:flagellar biosynthetic protein FlhB
MADENTPDQKTEEATPRRLERALEEGQIAFSSELVSGFMLLTGLMFFLITGSWFFKSLQSLIQARFTHFQTMIWYPETILLVIKKDFGQALLIAFSLVMPVSVVVLLISLMQTRFNFSTKPLALDWKKTNPLTGVKRMFSLRAVNRGAVAVAKSASIVLAAYLLTRARTGELASSGRASLEHGLTVGTELLFAIGFLAAGLMLVVGIADYGFQWWKQQQDLRMTKQEVRDEHKDVEGDPQLKARIRRIATELSRKRNIRAVPSATVIVTNPTHYAVALRYAPNESPAPIVVAKGADFLAKQIIQVAKENGIAVVERKPVARYLYANVKIGQQVPYEVFQAVAEILNFIRQLDNRAA